MADARPGGVAGAAEVAGDGVVHPVHVLLLQVGRVGMATGQRGRRGLAVAGRGEGWRGEREREGNVEGEDVLTYPLEEL